MLLKEIILAVVLLSALCAIMTRTLLKSAIWLAISSVALACLMFLLHSPLAAVFELSVCAGLITVIFVSAISLTQTRTEAEEHAHAAARIRRFGFLPILLILVVLALGLVQMRFDFKALPPISPGVDVRQIMWNFRPIDLLGQVIVLLAGVFGIVVLFKEKRENE